MQLGETDSNSGRSYCTSPDPAFAWGEGGGGGERIQNVPDTSSLCAFSVKTGLSERASRQYTNPSSVLAYKYMWDMLLINKGNHN